MKLDVYKFSEKVFEVEIPQVELENGAEVFIGRAQDCHIVLDDHQVSRHHAVLNLFEGKIHLRKLSSFGDLNVNGMHLEEATLNEGDKVSIQDFMIYPRDFTISIPSEDAGLIDEPTAILEADLSELQDDIPEPEISEEATEILTSLEEPEEEPVDEDSLSDSEDDSFDDHLSDEENEAQEFNQEDEFSEPESFEQSEDDSAFGGEESFNGDNDMFGDDAGFGDEAGGDSTQVFQSFANYYLVIDGEYAPFDKYKLEDNETFIGRDPEKCQIVLNDPEVSTIHTVLKKSLVNCSIEDLNSSNGTMFNGERINKAELSNNDNFQIGSTIFTVKVTSDLIESEKDMLMPVDLDQEVEVEEIVEEEVDYDEMNGEGTDAYSLEEAQEKSFIKRIWKDPKKRKIVIVLALLVLVLTLMEEETPSQKKVSNKNTVKKAVQKVEEPAKDFSEEVLGKLEENYALALAKYEAGEYYEAKEYLEIIRAIDPSYKDTETLRKLVKQGHEELLKLKAEEEAEKERKKRELKIKGLLERARASVEKREVAVSESLFGQILEIDPENMEVPQLKLEIDAFQAQQRKKREEEQIKKALRKAMVDSLQPGKTLFLKEEWYKAIDRLLKFTKKKGIDEDLMNDATRMLKEAKRNLSAQINPLLGRARSHKEGQDLKRAYETYGEVLKFDPSNEEALTEREKIFDSLRTRSMKVYREALISESLSLFDEAREKFEEVQQISPVNSEYYNKATERLKNYLE